MKMNLSISSILLALTCLACTDCFGYGPFEDGASPELCKMEEIPHKTVGLDEKNDRSFMTASSKDGSVKLYIDKQAEGYYLTLTKSGETLISREQFSCSDFFYMDIHQYDLNQDNVPDYVISTPYGGNGLAACLYQLAFVLSTDGDYKITTIDTHFLGMDSFIIIDEKPYCIQTSVPGVAHCNDGKDHAFWLYNLLTFTSGGEVKVSNEIHPAFPKAIWYSFAENHDETTLITKRQKDVLVKNSHKKLFWTPTPKPSDKTNSPQ